MSVRRISAVVAIVIGLSGAKPAAQPTAPASTSPALAAYTLGAGWATFGLALPRGAARQSLRVGALATQTDVKTTWPDGSIRFAVVTAKVSREAKYAIAGGEGASGTFDPAPVAASVRLKIGAVTWTATLPATRSDRWLEGSQVVEDRALVAPVADGGTHPFLRVRYDVRSYSGGGHRVDVSVENILDLAATDAVTYDVAIEVDGKEVFKQAAVRHYSFTRWRQVFRSGGLVESAVMPDVEPFMRANALPRYLASVNNTSRSINDARFGILRHGDLTGYMGTTGSRAEISPYPDWAAQYVVHRRGDQRAYLLRHGELGGSWAIHITSDGQRPISIDERSRFWLDNRGPEHAANEMRGTPQMVDGSSTPDLAHQPSLAFIPYLITGDRWFSDEMRYWANFCLIGMWPDPRGGALGQLWGEEIRGMGHALRNMADAAAYLPDSDPFREYFRLRVERNLTAFDEHAAKQAADPNNPFGFTMPWSIWKDNHPTVAAQALWTWYQLGISIDRAMTHGDYPADAGRRFLEVLTAFVVKTLTSEPEFPRLNAGPYLMGIGTYTRGGEFGVIVNYAKTMAQVQEYTKTVNGPTPTPLVGDWYGVQIRSMLLIDKRRFKRPGVDEALRWLMGLGGDESMVATVNRRSGYAFAE